MQAEDTEDGSIWERDNAGSYAAPLQPALCEQLDQVQRAMNDVKVAKHERSELDLAHQNARSFEQPGETAPLLG